MKITDAHIEAVRRDGYTVIEGLLSPEEAAECRKGIHQFFSPSYEDWVAAGNKNTIERPNHVFPWDHSGLNNAMAHPEFISAAQRLTGTQDVRLCEAHLGMKYAGQNHGEGWHIDYGNNTLGPELTDPIEISRHPAFLYYFNDVDKNNAPIMMLSHKHAREAGLDSNKGWQRGGETPPGAEKIMGPAGTVVIYTLYTWHSASTFHGTTGQRPAAWISMFDARYQFNFPRAFTYKSGASYPGMARFIREATPEQLQLLGFPRPGDPFWTPAYIAALEGRYPGFNGDRYRAAAKTETRVLTNI